MGLYVWKFGYRKVLEPLAKKLHWLDPDLVSFAALLVSLLTFACYIAAGVSRVFLLWAIVLIFLRMTMNTIDGVMAIDRNKKTLIGEIVNALPDRYADVFLMLGLVLTPLCDWRLGVLAMATVFLVSYTGMLGKALGVDWQHHGPLGKVERLILLMIFTLAQYFWPLITFGWFSLSPLSLGMVVYILLGQIAVWNRLQGQLAQIRIKEWPESPACKAGRGRIQVVYDSQTGNTKTIAETIAQILSAPCQSVNACGEVDPQSFLFLCTPNIRASGTKNMMAFLDRLAVKPRQYAVVVTYGAPLWGWPTALLVVRAVSRKWHCRPRGFLLVKGFHAKFKTYRGRPSETDKQRAALFAIEAFTRIMGG